MLSTGGTLFFGAKTVDVYFTEFTFAEVIFTEVTGAGFRAGSGVA